MSDNKTHCRKKTHLEDLARTCNSNAVRQYIEEHFTSLQDDPGLCDRLLQIVSCRGDTATLQVLIDCGVDGNSVLGFDGATPFLHAAHNGVCEKDFYQLLIASGADIDEKSFRQESALSLAVNCGSGEAATTLLSLGADVNNARDALMYAFVNYNDEQKLRNVAETLLDAGIDVSNGAILFRIANRATNAYGKPALTHQWKTSLRAIALKAINSGADIYAQDFRGKTLFEDQCYLSDMVLKFHFERLRCALVDICILLKPLDLPVLVVLEIYKQCVERQTSIVKKHCDVHIATLSLHMQWAVASAIKKR